MLGDLEEHLRQVDHLAPLHTDDGRLVQARPAARTRLGRMHRDPIGVIHHLERRPGVAWLAARLPPTRRPQALGPRRGVAAWRIARRGLAAVVAVGGRPTLELLDPRRERELLREH